MASNIGIKIANGEFYPILEENSSVKKRLVLSTVHDDQPSVQIDLFRSAANTMTDAQYIGSIVVEKIKPKLRGEPSIELVISSTKNGDIVADAIDLDTASGAEHYVLTVSLKSLDETSRDMEIPDFELDVNEEPPSGLYQSAVAKRQEKPKKSRKGLFILIGIILILALLAGWLFLFGGLKMIQNTGSANTVKTENIRPPEPVIRTEATETVRQVESAPVVTEAAAPSTPAAEPVIVQPIITQVEPPVLIVQPTPRRPDAPVYSFNIPAVIPREGVNYTIRWGDTLWDISDAFYQNPYLYTRIAQYNNIRNPNYIISGRTIRVPPKN